VSELPRLDDFGREIKYSRWDGTQRLDALEADELLGAMSDELLAGGDLEDALARLSRWGMPGRMEGMKDLLERLRSAKQKRAERHDLSKVFDELKEKLEEVKRLEREGLERRRNAEAPNEQLRQGMQKIAQERLAQLDALPDDFGRAVRALKDYEFVEPKGPSGAGTRVVLQEHARLTAQPHARAARAHAADDPRPEPSAEGAHGGRRARL